MKFKRVAGVWYKLEPSPQLTCLGCEMHNGVDRCFLKFENPGCVQDRKLYHFKKHKGAIGK